MKTIIVDTTKPEHWTHQLYPKNYNKDGSLKNKKTIMEKFIVMYEREAPLEHKELGRFDTLKECKDFRAGLRGQKYTYAYIVENNEENSIIDWRSKDKVEEEVCEYCDGTGEVSTDESDGEGHIMQGVGTQKCICQIEE